MSIRVATRYVAGFYDAQAGHVFVRKNRPAWMAGKLNAVGGHIEKGEPPAAAMAREFEEEAGVRIAPERWEHFATMHGVKADEPFVVYWFRAGWDPRDAKPRSMTDEEIVCVPTLTEPRWGGRETFMPNVYWLLSMQHRDCQHDWPYVIVESDGRGLELTPGAPTIRR